jgi:HEAT repeat protein
MMREKAAAPHLILLLADEHPGAQLGAAESLGAFGPQYVPYLLPLLWHPSAQVQQAVKRIWSTNATEEHLELLQPFLHDKDAGKRDRAFYLIESIRRRLNLPKDKIGPLRARVRARDCQKLS